MGDFFFSWIVVALSLLAILWLYSKMAFFQTLYKTQAYEMEELKEMIDEDKIVIELYEFEINKHLSNIDYLQKEVIETQTYLKEVRSKNTRLRNEISIANDKVNKMKLKLDALF